MNPSSGGSTEKLATQYFKTMKKSRIEELYKMYEKDFKMFGYNAKPYIDLGQPG